MSYAKIVNISRLLTSYNFEIEKVPDNLKCAKCKLVLKDACQLPCGCRYCRLCIDDMRASGGEFCPGDSEDCGDSSLSLFSSDYRVSKSISRLIVKCANNGCVYECPLATMEDHLRQCQRKSVQCPFCEMGCKQGKLAAEEIDRHLQQENFKHSELLIEMMKHRDEDSRREIDALKSELVLKDGQISAIKDRLIHLENENKSISREKADLSDRVRVLSEKIEREIDERHESDELDSARLIGRIDREITTIMGAIGSIQNELTKEMKSIRNDIRSMNRGSKWKKDDFCSMRTGLHPMLTSAALAQFDARFEWVIDVDVGKTSWGWSDRTSEFFTGPLRPYNCQLASWNGFSMTTGESLWIMLRIYPGPNDELLVWPLDKRVVIDIADQDRPEACRSISLQCQIDRPSDNDYNCSDNFVFRHHELIEAGLDLGRGVRVSCGIVPRVS